MEKHRQAEYDFFLRAAMLFEEKMIALTPRSDNIGVADIFRRYRDDAANARLWAERIKEGAMITMPQEQEVKREPGEPSEPVPPKYRY